MRASHFVVIFAWLSSSMNAQSPVVPRSQIQVFPYAVDGTADPKFPLKYLKPIIARLRDKLSSPSNHPKDLSLVKELGVEANDSEYPSDDDGLEAIWGGSHCLQILGGTIFAKSSPTILESLVYLGDLNGSINAKTLTVRTELTFDQYENLHDLFCALTMYVLAIEAKARGAEPSDVLFYLAQAESALPNPASGSNAIGSSVQELADAIHADIKALIPKGGP